MDYLQNTYTKNSPTPTPSDYDGKKSNELIDYILGFGPFLSDRAIVNNYQSAYDFASNFSMEDLENRYVRLGDRFEQLIKDHRYTQLREVGYGGHVLGNPYYHYLDIIRSRRHRSRSKNRHLHRRRSVSRRRSPIRYTVGYKSHW
jgi:hypothetical protein